MVPKLRYELCVVAMTALWSCSGLVDTRAYLTSGRTPASSGQVVIDWQGFNIEFDKHATSMIDPWTVSQLKSAHGRFNQELQQWPPSKVFLIVPCQMISAC
jgi:hypothetical protein